MRHLEQRRDAEGLGQICSQTGEGVVVQEHFALDLPGNVLNGSWVRQAQGTSPLLEGCICVLQSCRGSVVP